MYQRVIPRDFFNESKLLKCFGQLALLVHEEMAPPNVKIDYDDRGFIIDQHGEDDASLYFLNVKVYVNGNEIDVRLRYNAKDQAYPLLYETTDGDFEYMFKSDGTFTDEFIKFATVEPKFAVDQAVMVEFAGESEMGVILSRKVSDIGCWVYSVLIPGFDAHRNEHGELWVNEHEAF